MRFDLSFYWQFQYSLIQFIIISAFLQNVPLEKNTEEKHQVTNHNNPALEGRVVFNSHCTLNQALTLAWSIDSVRNQSSFS